MLQAVSQHSKSKSDCGFGKQKCSHPRAHPENEAIHWQRGWRVPLDVSGLHKGDSRPGHHTPQSMLLAADQTCCWCLWSHPSPAEAWVQAAQPAFPSSFCLFLKQHRADVQNG